MFTILAISLTNTRSPTISPLTINPHLLHTGNAWKHLTFSYHFTQISTKENAERERKYLAAHLVTRDGDEEEVRLIGVVGAEVTLSDVLKEIALAGVLPSELPRRLVERVGIPIRVYIHLELLLHLLVVELEHTRRVKRVRIQFFFFSSSTLLFFPGSRRVVEFRDGELGNLEQKGNEESGEK
ncbi:hypothetical protein V8G54_016148 [Vigna mungo]|uniref:Uncharacterized protein n=1 Tax=Vigna mungo TaxID=3915 RepID=A0AAQ3NNI0_VIGMU